MARHRVLLVAAHRVHAGEHLDRVAVELHVLAALDLNDLALRHAGGAHAVGVGLGADHHRVRLHRDVRHIRHVVPVSVTDENLVRLLHMLVDEGRVRGQQRARLQGVLQEP